MSSCCTRMNSGVRQYAAYVVLLAVLASGVAPVSAVGAPQVLLRTGADWAGSDIVYPAGDAEVTAVILRIEEGETPPFHCHPVPTFGYVLRGVVEVQMRDGRTAVFREGQAVVEVMRSVHRGRALEAPVEILVFYAGAAEMPTTVLPEDDPQGAYCDVVDASGER